MVTKKLLKEYKFNGIHEYFEMIMDSRYNGQLAQMFSQLRVLNKHQTIKFLEYVLDQEPKHRWKKWIIDIFNTKL